jgi:DNA-directed RNA polymerase specialized sigma24 family protein
MTQAEIGDSLGIAPGTVASRKSRALEILRERLGQTIGNKNGH